MANPNEITPNAESAKVEVAKLDLPSVESPSISPAELVAAPVSEPAAPAPVIEPVAAVAPEAVPAAVAPVAEPAAETGIQIIWPTFTVPKLRPRHKRHALLAASVTLAAALGAVVGAVASGGFSKPAPQVNVATIEDRKALEQSIARLTSQVTTLKTSLETVNKTAHAQIAKISERADRIERSERNASAELVTGSISAPQTVPAAAAPLPVPTPRPAPRIAAPEVAPPSRPQIVQDWAIREARDGYVYVQGHSGDVFQVVTGAPLPGLGPVESIRRQDGRWVVTTPKGIIVSMRDRRYFE